MIKRIWANIEAMLLNKSTREVGYKNRSFKDVVDQNYHIMNSEQRIMPDLAKKYFNKDFSFLELGCGAGRNLECLRQHGFNNLYGIEASRRAINVAKHYFPELYKIAKFKSGYLQKNLKPLKDNDFDVVFTLAVLQHILSDTDSLFANIARITKRYLVTIEFDYYSQKRKDIRFEYNPKERVPRNYNKIFSNLGFEQIEVFGCWEIPIKINELDDKTSSANLEIIQKIRNFARNNKRSPTAGETDKKFINLAQNQFGSWLKALEYSGIEKPYSGMAYTVRIFKKR